MTRVHSFHGGIHPPENKRQSNGAPIRPAPIRIAPGIAAVAAHRCASRAAGESR